MSTLKMVNRIEKILLVGSGLWYFAAGMLGPLFAIFAEQIGGDIFNITWAWATYLLVTGILTVILGKYSDSLNKEKMMVWGYGLNAVFTFGYIFVSNPFQLMFLQASLGLAAALATPTWDALYAQHEDKKAGGLAWGIADGMPNVVTGVAILLGGMIVTYLSFNALFITMGVIQLISAIYQGKILYYKKG